MECRNKRNKELKEVGAGTWQNIFFSILKPTSSVQQGRVRYQRNLSTFQLDSAVQSLDGPRTDHYYTLRIDSR
jgi:hypothetical protein